MAVVTGLCPDSSENGQSPLISTWLHPQRQAVCSAFATYLLSCPGAGHSHRGKPLGCFQCPMRIFFKLLTSFAGYEICFLPSSTGSSFELRSTKKKKGGRNNNSDSYCGAVLLRTVECLTV